MKGCVTVSLLKSQVLFTISQSMAFRGGKRVRNCTRERVGGCEDYGDEGNGLKFHFVMCKDLKD
jgi:hypothetical protein